MMFKEEKFKIKKNVNFISLLWKEINGLNVRYK